MNEDAMMALIDLTFFGSVHITPLGSTENSLYCITLESLFNDEVIEVVTDCTLATTIIALRDQVQANQS